MTRYLSVRLRLTFLFAVIFGGTTVLFSWGIYYSLNDSLLQDFDDALYNYCIDVAQNIEIGPTHDLLIPPLRFEHEKIFPFSSGNSFFIIRHSSGQILTQVGKFNPDKIPFSHLIQKIFSGADSAYTTLHDLESFEETEADNYRLITFPLDNSTAPQLFLQIAVPMTTFEKQLERMKLILSVGVPAVIFISVLLGFYFSARALSPVSLLIANTKNIGADNLKERLPVPFASDEIKDLAQTLNEMLERIEKSFSSQEKFVADASHQLLTPLTILKGEIESHFRDFPDQILFHQSLLQEVENLSKIVKDMLLLARVDAGAQVLYKQDVDIEDLVVNTMSELQKMADIKNIKMIFQLRGDEFHHSILADPDLLRTVIYNLLENALKYSAPHQSVHISLEWFDQKILFKVTDSGPGISDQNKSLIFERFSRVGSQPENKGYGLGLSIAKKIADLHHFKLFVEDSFNAYGQKQPGACFGLEIKKN